MSGSRDAASTDLRKNDTKEVGTYQPLIFMPNSNRQIPQKQDIEFMKNAEYWKNY